MEEITKIYNDLKSFLSEIIITTRSKKVNFEVGEDMEGEPIFEAMNSTEVLFNKKLFHLYLKELDYILSIAAESIKEAGYLNSIENIREIERIIDESILKIENREVFIIEQVDDKVNVKDFRLNDSYISRIKERLASHRNSLWDYEPSTIHKMNKNDIKNSSLVWRKNKTDLLELVTALYENKALDNYEKNLTRKEATEIFLQFFNLEIKDPDSLLSHATDRSNESPFLKTLKESYEDYVKGLSKKQEDRYKGRTKF